MLSSTQQIYRAKVSVIKLLLQSSDKQQRSHRCVTQSQSKGNELYLELSISARSTRSDTSLKRRADKLTDEKYLKNNH